MERIRIGNNIAISWAVYDLNGRIHNLEGKELRLYMAVGGYKVYVNSYTIQGNVISWVFLGSEQTKTGDYKLVLEETDPLSGASAFDVRAAFRLTPEDVVGPDIVVGPANVSVQSVLTYSNLVGVESIDVVESSEDSGDNIVTIHLIDGSFAEVVIKNGSKGPKGDTGATGATGPKGGKGDTGERGPVGVDTVNAAIGTNDPSQAPSVDKTFADGVLGLTFNNIKGAKGDKGDQGDQGNTGSSVDYPYELVNNVTTDDATKGLSAAQGVVLDGRISQLGQYVDNPEFVQVILDADNKVLYGVQVGGNFYFGAGVPYQIREYITQKLTEKVDKVPGKGLSTNDYTNVDKSIVDFSQIIDNPEWDKVILDSDGKILEGVKKTGVKVVNIPVEDLASLRLVIDNKEWLVLITDSNNKILFGIKKKGTICGDKVTLNAITCSTLNVEKGLILSPRVKAELKEELVGDVAFLNASPIQIIESCAAGVGNTGQAVRHKKLVVAHITDTHNDDDRMARFGQFCGYDIIDFGIHTGDIALVSSWESMLQAIDKQIFLTIGNHDTTTPGPGLNAYLYEKYISPMAEKDGITIAKNYYYIDNSDYGHTIRFIFMNEYDFPDNVEASQISDNLGYYNSIYSQEQIDWLIDTLQDCIDNNYYVVICSHQRPAKTMRNTKPFFQEKEYWNPAKNYNGDILGDLVNIYKHGGRLTRTYPPIRNADILPEISIDQEFSGTGNFIAFMNGHSHGDYIGYSENYSDQLMLNAPMGKGRKYISPSTQQENVYSDLPRSVDDETQDCYNVYVFDIDGGFVHVIRIGSNLTYYMSLRKYAKYKF